MPAWGRKRDAARGRFARERAGRETHIVTLCDQSCGALRMARRSAEQSDSGASSHRGRRERIGRRSMHSWHREGEVVASESYGEPV
jgi:hypothetical protein